MDEGNHGCIRMAFYVLSYRSGNYSLGFFPSCSEHESWVGGSVLARVKPRRNPVGRSVASYEKCLDHVDLTADDEDDNDDNDEASGTAAAAAAAAAAGSGSGGGDRGSGEDGARAEAVSCGYYHTCALVRGGK